MRPVADAQIFLVQIILNLTAESLASQLAELHRCIVISPLRAGAPIFDMRSWTSPADYEVTNAAIVNFFWSALDEFQRQKRHAAVANMLSVCATEKATVGEEVPLTGHYPACIHWVSRLMGSSLCRFLSV